MKRKYFFGNLMLLLELISLATVVALLVFVYQRFIELDALAFLIFLNAFVIVALYYILRWHFKATIRRSVSAMSTALENLSNDDAEWAKGDLLPFFNALSALIASLHKKDATRQEVLNVVNSVAINMDFEKVLEDLMPKLIGVTGSNCCAFYSLNSQTNKLEIKQSVGFSKNIYSEFDLNLGEGLIGEAAMKNQTTVKIDIPDDTAYMIRTFLGKLKPRNMLITPIYYHDQMTGVMVFASLHEYTPEELEMVEMIKYYVGVAVANGMTYEKTKRLSNELKFQNKLIQNLNDELEKKVEDRSLFLNDILNSIKDYAIYSISKNGIILTWNYGSENLMGFKSEEVIGKNIEEFYDPDRRESVRRRIQIVLNEGKYYENAWRLRRDGTKFYYETHMFCMYNDKNEIIGITNITKDITNLKSVESALWFEKEVSMRILESSSRALLFADDNGVILLANHNAETLLEQEFLTGRALHEFFDDSGTVEEQLRDTARKSYYNEISCKLREENDVIQLRISVMDDDEHNEKRLFITLKKAEF